MQNILDDVAEKLGFNKHIPLINDDDEITIRPADTELTYLKNGLINICYALNVLHGKQFLASYANANSRLVLIKDINTREELRKLLQEARINFLDFPPEKIKKIWEIIATLQ